MINRVKKGGEESRKRVYCGRDLRLSDLFPREHKPLVLVKR